GLFIYTMWVVRFHEGFSGLAAAMALSVLMLPTVARTAEEVIKLVPNGLRESSLALGAPGWKTTLGITLPAARSGLVTAPVPGGRGVSPRHWRREPPKTAARGRKGP